MARTYAIADMHGRYDLFAEAFRVMAQHGAGDDDKVIILGDFVDRGPGSREIITNLRAVQGYWGDRLIALQGNHEAMMLEVLRIRSPELVRWWIGNGGGETLRSYGYVDGDTIAPVKVPADNLAWLAHLPVTYEDEHRIYVHAGVPFDQEIADAKRDTLQWMLYAGYPEDGTTTICPDEQHVSGKHIVHGHDQSDAHPLLRPHRTNLDSHAYATGRLAIGVFDDDAPGGPIETLWAVGART